MDKAGMDESGHGELGGSGRTAPPERAWAGTPEPALNRAFAYIRDYWPELTRPGAWLAFPLPNPYVRPGGFFKMFVYWDSYFILLGLVTQGQWELAAGIVDNMIYAVERLGHVPCYVSSKTACRSRSQPPFLTSAIREVAPFAGDREWLARAVAAAEREYLGYWMAEPHLTSLGLSRYIDPGDDGCVTVPDTPHFRAMAESGWDNTARFGDDTTAVAPVDLNAQLFRYEQDLAELSAELGRDEEAAAWRARAASRRELVNRYLWDAGEGFYHDLDLRTGQPLRAVPRALSAFVPLWAGLADARQAASMAAHLPLFEHDHGLAATEPGWTDGDQHSYPTGWAYSHWYVAEGLRRAGYREDAVRIALKWLRLVAARLDQAGVLLERYNVVDPDGPAPGRYPPQPGFGWTNGVFAALLTRVVLDINPASTGRPGGAGGAEIASALPASWRGQEIRVNLPRYPWPAGTRRAFAARAADAGR
jgi:alpha,alpha-trehalase